jgi:hypothetical protein
VPARHRVILPSMEGVHEARDGSTARGDDGLRNQGCRRACLLTRPSSRQAPVQCRRCRRTLDLR